MESKKPPPYTAEEGVEALPASLTKQDDNYDIYQRYRGSEFTPEEEARVLRKIDIRLIPLLFGIYLIQYLDKNSLNFASVYGLKTGTKLEGQDYSWLGAYSSYPHSLIIACSCLSQRIDILYWISCGPVSVWTGVAEIAYWEVLEYHHFEYDSSCFDHYRDTIVANIYSMGRASHDHTGLS